MINNQELLILYLEDELDDQARAVLEERLTKEPELATELAELREFFGVMEAELPEEPEGDYWRNFYSRLQPKLEKKSIQEKLLDWLAPGHSMNYVRAAGAFAILVIMVGVALNLALLKHEPENRVTVTEVKIEKRESILALVVNKHLDRSRILLEEMVNISATGENLEEELDYTRNRGQRLLGINRTYQAVARKNGNAEMEALLADLELVLLEIANINFEDAEYAIPSLKKVIRRKNLLIKIEIINLDEYRSSKRVRNTEVM